MKKIFLTLLGLVLTCCFVYPKKGEAKEQETVYPTVVLGGGVGAMTSSLYLSRAQVLPLVIEGKTPGGVITQSHLVENWPGEIGISGVELADKLKKQAEANGAQFVSQEVVDVNLSTFPYVITAKDLYDDDNITQYKAYSVVVAMGTTPNYLGVPGEQDYWGKGVTNCATCDGSLYHGKTVAVIGGGDAAIVEADYLSNIAKKVNIYIRKDTFKAQDIALKESVLKKDNVEVFFKTTVEEINGDQEGVTSFTLKTDGKTRDEKIDGVFLAIGSTPNSEILKGKIALDERGYVELTKDQQTSVEGVYAIGDIADEEYKQAVSAAGDGAKAAMQAEKYLRNLQVKNSEITYLKPLERTLDHREPAKQVAYSNNASKKVEKPKKEAKVIDITSAAQFAKELNTDMPVLVDFYATWCGPCKRIAPEIDKAAKDLSGKAKILKVDIDKLGKLADKYQIRSMPTVIVISNNKEINRKVGPKEILPYTKKLVKANDIDSVIGS